MKKEIIGLGLIASGLVTISVGAYGLYKNFKNNNSNAFEKALEEEVNRLLKVPKKEEKKED